MASSSGEKLRGVDGFFTENPHAKYIGIAMAIIVILVATVLIWYFFFREETTTVTTTVTPAVMPNQAFSSEFDGINLVGITGNNQTKGSTYAAFSNSLGKQSFTPDTSGGSKKKFDSIYYNK